MTIEINRNKAPEVKSIQSVDIALPKAYKLSNGTEVFVFDNPNQELLKIEFVFENGGTAYSPKPMVASITNAMLSESTTNYSSAELADKVDYFGASFETNVTRDSASVSLYSLNKFLDKTLPLLKDVISNANYEQNEIDIHISRRKQEFMVNSEKVDFIARQNFTQLLFGKNHPYGKYSTIEDFDNVDRDDLLSYHSSVYKHGKHKVFIAGKFSSSDFELLDSLFGKMEFAKEKSLELNWEKHPAEDKYTFMPKEGAVQNAIRMGFVGLNNDAEDYNGLRILTTFLGGYFGSRLMSNIREDKGYTYGIGAAHSSFKSESVFFIATEVKSEVADDTVSEIKKELLRLQKELISEEELITVKNYLQGSFQRQFDGSFAMMGRFIYINMNNLDYSFYYNYIEEVKSIDANKLQKLALKYFNEEDFYILNVGN